MLHESLDFSPEIIVSLKKHAEAVYPDECSGVIIRVPSGQHWVLPNMTTTNSDQFSLPAALLLDARRKGRIVAFYHSHPDAPARPSHRDLASMCTP